MNYKPEKKFLPPVVSDREYIAEIKRLNDSLDHIISFSSAQTLDEVMEFAQKSKSSNLFLK